jgi:UDP-glucose:(heptosyl)LPS alpha-1,3-glucosyltransferase
MQTGLNSPQLAPTGQHIIQVVRNWGPVGGMESYVWHLSHALAQNNYRVTIVCEKSHAVTVASNIDVIETGLLPPKPRWILYWRFANKVEAVVQSIQGQCIVHSHERCISHDLTTFHSMPFAGIKDKSIWRRLSIRVWAYLRMEARELGVPLNPAVSIVPVSAVIAKAISKHYPSVVNQIASPIAPGVMAMPQRPQRVVTVDGGTIGFIGKEWGRKGFTLFMQIATQLLKQRPHLRLVVLGPEQAEVADQCRNYPGAIAFLGWQSSESFFQDLDLLIHPASSEAYGMVIAEAMVCHLPVLVSDACGAAVDVSERHGTVLSLHHSVNQWAQAADALLRNTHPMAGYLRPWSQVAAEYETQYHAIALKKYQTTIKTITT